MGSWHSPPFPVVGLVALSMMGCGGSQDEPAPLAELPDAAAVQGAPSSVETAGGALTMEATLWHDDMPGADNSGLMVVTTLKSAGTVMPAGVRLERVYVVRGSEVWAPAYSDEERPPPAANEIDGIARNGPTWRGPGTVDVVARIRLGSGESTYLAHREVEIVSAQ